MVLQHSLLSFAGMVSITVCQILSSSADAQTQALAPGELLISLEQSPQVVAHDDKLCGVYSMTYLLRLYGQRCTPDDIRHLLPVRHEGSSLRDMREAARHRGISMEVVQCVPESLDSLTVPAIAHLEPTDLLPMAHYVVLLRVDNRSVTLFDWNTRTVDTYGRNDFLERASGYYLAEHHSSQTWSVLLGYALVALLAGALLWLLARRPDNLWLPAPENKHL